MSEPWGRTRFWIIPVLVCLVLPSWGQDTPKTFAPDQIEFFESRIRPVLSSNCYACHTSSRLGGLQVDSREGLLNGGKSGPAIVPGKPEESLLIRAVRQEDDRLKMPMGGKLTDREIADLTNWVKLGAPWPDRNKPLAPAAPSTHSPGDEQKAFWAFQPIARSVLPSINNPEWVQSPIDRFVLASLETQGLRPVKAVDKRTLIRRATFDLIGLPPTPREIEEFLADDSSNAFAKVVDRLLGSPHYGERWGRYWLDVARYGEDDVRSDIAVPYRNAWRYRDWVIRAFNQDMPYDLFVRAQIAGDLLEGKNSEDVVAGTGFFGLGPWYYDIAQPPQARADEHNDRVDALSRGFLGLTVACARCHDHKYDPISMNDYYALAGVFGSSEYEEYPLSPQTVVFAYKDHQARLKKQEANLNEFLEAKSTQLGEILAKETSRYMMAAWKVLGPAKSELVGVAEAEKLDRETLERWVTYLANPHKEYSFLEGWSQLLIRGGRDEQIQQVADEFQRVVLAVLEEKKQIDKENQHLIEQAKPAESLQERLLPNAFVTYYDYCSQCGIALRSIAREKFVLWSDLFASAPDKNDPVRKDIGILCHKGEKLERFLSGESKNRLEAMRAELDELKRTTPTEYPFLHGLRERLQPADLKLHLRGSPYNLGEEVPRRFLAILSQGQPVLFQKGSGRLELAEAVARHPLTARVMVNRIWSYHFGRGIVDTPSNFGQLGDRPSHPELIEYLASRFIENGYSLKALHREMMLSSTYQLSSDYSERNFAADPDNRLLWRASRRRLDAEALRDSILFVSGSLDPTLGGPSAELNEDNQRRTVYSKISRFRIDSLLRLFDFPDPSITSERRNVTNVPLQGLFFMNSRLISNQAKLLAQRLSATDQTDDQARIKAVYRLLYGREATESEVHYGLIFLQGNAMQVEEHVDLWREYAQVLLSSNEFVFVN